MLAEVREEKKQREKAPVPAGVSRKRTKKKIQENKSCSPTVAAEGLQTRRLYTRDQVPWVQQLCSPGDNGQSSDWQLWKKAFSTLKSRFQNKSRP